MGTVQVFETSRLCAVAGKIRDPDKNILSQRGKHAKLKTHGTNKLSHKNRIQVS